MVALLGSSALSSAAQPASRDGIWLWGDYPDDVSSLCINSDTATPAPVLVSGLTDVAAVGASSYNIVALRQDGTVWTWGAGYGGVPTQVAGLGQVVSISSGSSAHHSLA